MTGRLPRILLVASPDLAMELAQMLKGQGCGFMVETESAARSRLASSSFDVVLREAGYRLDLEGQREDGLSEGVSPILWITEEEAAEGGESGAVWGPWSDESLTSAVYRLLLESRKQREHRILDQFPMPAYLWRLEESDEYRLVGFNERAREITNGGVERFLDALASNLYEDRLEIVEPFDECIETGRTIVRDLDYDYVTTGETRHLRVHYCRVSPSEILVFTESCRCVGRSLAACGAARVRAERWQLRGQDTSEQSIGCP